MKLGIMQPYLFPYLGYFSLMMDTDQFVLFDVAQHIRHGWIERNRILKPGEGWQYITAPLAKHHLTTTIKNLRINNSEDWRSKLLRQLEHYKKRSPFYTQTIEVVRESINIDTDSIVHLNAHSLKTVCDYLSIPVSLSILSDMNLSINEVHDAGEWALNISMALGAEEYWNPIGGIEIFDRAKFESADIKLRFLKHRLPPYSQRRAAFEPGLSILDTMMFNSADAIREMVADYDLV